MLGCGFSGLAVVTNLANPTSLEQLVQQEFFVWIFGLLIFSGALLVLVGSRLEDRLSGLLVERVGLLSLLVPTASYSVALLIYNANVAIVAAGFSAGVAAGCIMRYREAGQEIKLLAQHLGGDLGGGDGT